MALLATIPFLIAAARDLLTSKAIGLRGDLALEDAAVRQAIQLSRALGAYDRFGWHHLGPALFYIPIGFWAPGLDQISLRSPYLTRFSLPP